MGSLSAGQVVLATFTFSDLKSKKVRPCLVIGIAEFDDVVLCQITSSKYESKRAISLGNRDFIKGSIAVESYIRPDKIATLDRKTIKQVLGAINNKKHTEVKSVLKDFFSIV